MARVPIYSDQDPVDPAAILRIGRIASIDLATGLVIVECGEVRTAPIPFSTFRCGETRIWSPPSIGEQVLLLCPDGDIEAAIALGAIAQDAFPLAGSTLRELIRFKDSAELAYDPEEHHLDITLPGGATMAITATGGLSITGDVDIDGDVSVSGKVKAASDVIGGNISLKNHKHSGVQSGASITGGPV